LTFLIQKTPILKIYCHVLCLFIHFYETQLWGVSINIRQENTGKKTPMKIFQKLIKNSLKNIKKLPNLFMQKSSPSNKNLSLNFAWTHSKINSTISKNQKEIGANKVEEKKETFHSIFIV
jgi:hypothetical protein